MINIDIRNIPGIPLDKLDWDDFVEIARNASEVGDVLAPTHTALLRSLVNIAENGSDKLEDALDDISQAIGNDIKDRDESDDLRWWYKSLANRSRGTAPPAMVVIFGWDDDGTTVLNFIPYPGMVMPNEMPLEARILSPRKSEYESALIAINNFCQKALLHIAQGNTSTPYGELPDGPA